jgi:zinc protease
VSARRAAAAIFVTVFLAACGGAGKVNPKSQVLLQVDKDPLVAFRLVFGAGSVHDPAGKEGLASLTADVIDEGGTRQLTYKQLLDALYPTAASISVRADKEATTVSGTVHRDKLDAYYAILRQVLLEPRFDPADFERLKQDHLNYLQNVLRATDDENLGKEALAAVMYPGHPYGRPTVGTVEGIKAITLDDVKAFHRAYFTRDNVTIGLAGAYSQELLGRVQADVASLPVGDTPGVVLPEPRAPQGIEALIVTKPTRAWAISIGYPLPITRADDDFYALAVANSYLGEHRTFNGVLMKKMRGERGFNYGDYSYIENFIQEGGSTFPLPNIPRRQQFFSIWIRPLAPKNAHFAIRQALREVDRLVRDGMSEEDFAATRDFLANYSRLFVQTSSRRLGYEMDGVFYNRQSVVEELGKRLPTMTRDQVNAAIRKYLQAKNAYVAVVADPEGAAAFAEALKTDAPSPVSYDTATNAEVLAEDKEIAVWPLAVRADALKVVAAETLFER